MPNQTVNVRSETSVRDLPQEDLENLLMELSLKATKKDQKIIPVDFRVNK